MMPVQPPVPPSPQPRSNDRILFLGYAKVGSRGDLEVPAPRPPASGRHGVPSERPPATVGGAATRPWWEH